MATALPSAELGSGLGRDARLGGLAQRLQALGSADKDLSPEEENSRRAELHQAAQDFEAMFINLMLNELRPEEEEDGLFGGSTAGSFYRGMFDTELSRVMSRSGQLGLAEMIEEQVARMLGLEEGEEGLIPGKVLGRIMPTSVGRRAAGAYEAVERSTRNMLRSFIAPLEGGRISSSFGERVDPIDGKRRRHNGVDFAASEGAPVKASAAGVVKFSGRQPGYGNVVIIEHAGGYETRYAHNSDNLVRKGEVVSKGQVIASVGSTGRSTGPHLHFEVRCNGAAVNPFEFIR